MGFEPEQGHSHLESINKFKERMEDTLTEAKAALAKSKDKMSKYYDRRQTPAPVYQPRDKVYLDASDIQMTRPSQKLTHKTLGPFTIVRKVGNGAYRLHLLPSMSRLHPVFNIVVKLRFNLENDRRKIFGVEIRIERIYVRDTELEV